MLLMGHYEINEIRKGQTGTGLLIENDGHIIAPKDTLEQIREDISSNKKFTIPDDFIVSAVFQKYGIKNANGRIYPERILKKEVDRYIREVVNKNAAIGALDHPQCQLADTQILTKYGWKNITEVEVDEEIQTLNTTTREIETHKVVNKIESHYEGEIYHLKSRFINLEVTPNHKFPIFNRNHTFKGFFSAEQIYNHEVPDQNHSYIPKTGEWVGDNDEYFDLPQLDDDVIARITKSKLKEKYSTPLRIPMNVWMKFMGIYLSEGSVSGPDSIHIFQKKKQVCHEIENMLNEFPLNYTVNHTKDGCTVFNIFDLRLYNYLKQFGICYDKYIPYSIKKQNKEMLRIFYDWFVMGDGRKRCLGRSKGYYSDDVFSTSKRMVMDLNEIQLKIGYCGRYHEEDRHYDRVIEGRIIKGENAHNMHFTLRSHNNAIWLNDKSLTITKKQYNGMVYCVEVENHNFYTMDKSGFCLWSGNSSTLSGHDVAMRILNLEWNGKTLVGDMKLHLSEGFKKYGVCSTSGDKVANMLMDDILIGVSSRGLGSVKKEGDALVVGDDFEILCWDVVINPSTPSAFIGKSRSELEQYIESENKEGNSLNEKITRLEKILI